MGRALASVAAALTAAVLGLCCPGRANARPVTVEDLLQREDLGAAAIAPGGRWLLVERRGPYAQAPRFDLQLFNPLLRTRIMVADLDRPGRLRPLLRAKRGSGYQLGPISPDGARAVVYRLAPDGAQGRWTAGIVRLATGAVHWLPLTPEAPGSGRALQWTAPTTLVLIARGDAPFELRWMDPAPALTARWAATARGGLAVTAVGSGQFLGLRPEAAPTTIVRVDARTLARRILATGDFTDLEASPDGRRLALLEAAHEIPMSAAHPVQGDWGLATRRQRLALLDLSTGALRRHLLGEDLLDLLSWSPAGDALLVYGRADGTPWTDGRLFRIRAATGRAEPVGATLRPAIERRPEALYAGWWGPDPLVFARSAPGGRLDWWRLRVQGPVQLTGDLAQPPRSGLTVAADGLRLLADGAAWAIEPDGHARRLASGVRGVPARSAGVPARTSFTVSAGALPPLLQTRDGQTRVLRLGADASDPDPRPLAAGLTPLLAGPGLGLLAERVTGGGREDLVWRAPDGREVPLDTLNRRFTDIDIPIVLPVRHTGPNGEALTSWVLLPAKSGREPPPLIVEAYLGTTYPVSPLPRLYADGPLVPTAALLAHGYAVLLPSLPVRRPSAGPGDRLAEQVMGVVDAAAADAALAGKIDTTRLGLWGHSFGGYTVMQTLTQTGRFRAAVAQAGMSDLVSQWGTFSVGRRTFPDQDLATPYAAGWTEDLQGDMRAPPWADPARYVSNSPLFHADQITTPLMLVHGDLDQFSIGQAEEMFSALARQDKDAILITYFGEKHLYASPGTWRDLYARLFGWFDGHLSQ